jgi:precorrin-3B C17-methyltransferase
VSTASEGGSLVIVGIGPDGADHLTAAAARALRESAVVIGYHGYLDLIRRRVRGKRVLESDIGQELQRVEQAIGLATSGERVAIVSGGDAGVYGMAGPIFEALARAGWQPGARPAVRVIPGVTAAQIAAAAVGAPLMQDYAVISLSDLLTPWPTIVRRIEAAAAGDFVLVFYNPASQRRRSQIREAFARVIQHRGAGTPVACVRDAGRPGQTIAVSNLGDAAAMTIDMRTLVIVGSSQTRRLDDLLITPRGYQFD